MPTLSAARRVRRRLNRRFYRCLLGIYRGVFPTPQWPGRLPASVRRVLIVRHDHIGDMVVTTPLIALLKDHLPDTEIDVLASSGSAALLATDERIARTFVNDHTWPSWLRVLPRLRAREYDAVLSLVYGRGLREGVTASLIARRDVFKVTVWRPARYVGLFTTVARPPRSARHMADQLLYLGYHALGLRWPGAAAAAARYPMRVAVPPTSELRISAFLSDHTIDRFILVNLAATDDVRRWRPEPSARFIAAALERHPELAVILPRVPGQEADAHDVAGRFAGGRVVVAPALSVLEFTALLRRALVVVTPDTGALHLASAAARPVVALFTPTSVHLDRWLPWRVPYRYVMAGPGEAISNIEPDRIVAAFDELHDEIGQTAVQSLSRA
jgi:ADP-heptose:LPS heptosyltransferase